VVRGSEGEGGLLELVSCRFNVARERSGTVVSVLLEV